MAPNCLQCESDSLTALERDQCYASLNTNNGGCCCFGHLCDGYDCCSNQKKETRRKAYAA